MAPYLNLYHKVRVPTIREIREKPGNFFFLLESQGKFGNFNIICRESGKVRENGLDEVTVAVNHENDTCFENRLVMGYADCKYYAGLVETSKVVSIVSPALCQTHCKQVPVFSRLSKSDLIMWASFIC